MGKHVGDQEEELPLVDMVATEDPKSPYHRYVAAGRFFIAGFTILTNMADNGDKPLF